MNIEFPDYPYDTSEWKYTDYMELQAENQRLRDLLKEWEKILIAQKSRNNWDSYNEAILEKVQQAIAQAEGGK